MISLEAVTHFLDEFLSVKQYSNDENGIYHPSPQPIQRLGLVLDPWGGLAEWVSTHQLDAIFLHRPWKVALSELPSELGIFFYHLPFDEHLTLGWNPRLAQVLGMRDLEILGLKEGRPVGMIGNITPQLFQQQSSSLQQRVQAIFGGYEREHLSVSPFVSRIAVVGAMNEALVIEAAQKGAQVYLTGQWRKSGEGAVLETGMGVIAVGHHRAELWGLQALAGTLRERWDSLEVVISR